MPPRLANNRLPHRRIQPCQVLELHRHALDVFATGHIGLAGHQAAVAKTNVILLCTDVGQRFEITVRRSFASYLFDWLCEAGS